MVTPFARPARTVAVLLAAGAIAWAAYAWWPSEERRVRKRLAALAEAVNDRPRGGLDTIARGARLALLFDPDVVVEAGGSVPPIHGREQLIALATRAPNDGGSFTVSFVDITITIDGASASSHLTATLEWQDANGQPNVDAREATLDWRKTDEWRIVRITAVDPLEKPH